jgi:hypothetical protein
LAAGLKEEVEDDGEVVEGFHPLMTMPPNPLELIGEEPFPVTC